MRVAEHVEIVWAHSNARVIASEVECHDFTFSRIRNLDFFFYKGAH